MNGLEAPSAMSTWAPVSAATELAPNAIDAGVRTLIGSGPIRNPRPGARIPIAVANADAAKVPHRPAPNPADPRGMRRLGDLERLQVGTVQPERQHRFDRRPHSIAASPASPQRMRPA